MPLIPVPNPVTGVMNAISDQAGDRFKDMVISLSKMLIESGAWMFGGVVDRINTSTSPDVHAGWFTNGPLLKMVGVAGFLLAIMAVLGICHAVASGDPGAIARRVLIELPGAVLSMTVLLMVTGFGIALTDALSSELMAGTATPVKEFVKTMTEASTRDLALNPAVVMGLSALFLLISSMVVWVELVIRSALIYLLVALAPLAIAARVWPVTRAMGARVTQFLAGFILAKLIAALCLSIGLAALANGPGAPPAAPAAPGSPEAAFIRGTGPSPGSPAMTSPGSGPGGATAQDAVDIGTILVGVALVGLAAFSPFTAIRLMPIAENASSQQGVKGGPGRAITTAASTVTLAKSVKGG